MKRPEHATIFWQMASEHGIEEFPAVCVVAEVCRDELLFEIDAEVVLRKLRKVDDKREKYVQRKR